MDAIDATLEQRATRLGASDMFRALSPATLADLARHARARRVAKGERLVVDESHAVFVFSGELFLVRSMEPRLLFLNVPAGSVTHVSKAIGGAGLPPHPCDIEAAVPSSVLLLSGEQLRQLVCDDAAFATVVIQRSAEHVALAHCAYAMMHVRDSEARVLTALRAIAMLRGLSRRGSVRQLAIHVGLRRETVSRALASLGRRGLVGRRDGCLWVSA